MYTRARARTHTHHCEICKYLTAGSQPQAVILPRLQAAVTAYVTPAELIAYVKAASLLPVNRQYIFLKNVSVPLYRVSPI